MRGAGRLWAGGAGPGGRGGQAGVGLAWSQSFKVEHGERAAVLHLPAAQVGSAGVAEVVGVVSPQPDKVVAAVGPALEACVRVPGNFLPLSITALCNACEEQSEAVTVQPPPRAAKQRLVAL